MNIELAFALLVLLFLKHFVVDFITQTETMVKEKGIYGAWGGIVHSSQHALLTGWIILIFAPELAIILAFADGIIHYHIDWAKMQIGKGLTPADKNFWVYLGLDQLLHYITYLGIAYVAVS